MLPLDLTAAVLTWLRAHEAGRLLRVQKLPASEFDALTATVRQVGERDERARFGGIGLSITDAKALLRRRFAYKEELLGSIDRLNNSGWTMLMVKVARKSPPNLVADHEDEVRALIAAGADVNFAPAQSRATALHLAALHGRAEFTQLLLAAGANVDTRACDRMPLGRTPLSWAVWSGQASIVEMLLEAGADPSTVSSRAGSPLHLAHAKYGAEDSIVALLKAYGGENLGPDSAQPDAPPAEAPGGYWAAMRNVSQKLSGVVSSLLLDYHT